MIDQAAGEVVSQQSLRGVAKKLKIFNALANHPKSIATADALSKRIVEQMRGGKKYAYHELYTGAENSITLAIRAAHTVLKAHGFLAAIDGKSTNYTHEQRFCDLLPPDEQVTIEMEHTPRPRERGSICRTTYRHTRKLDGDEELELQSISISHKSSTPIKNPEVYTVQFIGIESTPIA